MKNTALILSVAAGVFISSGVFCWITSGPGEFSTAAASTATVSPPLADVTEGSPSIPPLAHSLAPSERGRQALNSDDPEIVKQALEKNLRDWVAQDAPAAAAYARSLKPGDLRDRAMRIVAQTWGAEDPEAASAWAASLPDDAERRDAFGATCLGLAVRDPEGGVRLASRLGLRGDGMLENLTQQWAEKDEASALAWALQQPAGTQRQELVQRIALVEARRNPAAAAGLVVTQIPAGPVQIEAVISVINQWAQRDPAGASAWVVRLPEGEIQQRATNELIAIASSRDE